MLKRGPGAGYGMRGFIVKSISPSSPPFLEGKEIECRRGMLSYKRTNPQRMREESKREREKGAQRAASSFLVLLTFRINPLCGSPPRSSISKNFRNYFRAMRKSRVISLSFSLSKESGFGFRQPLHPLSSCTLSLSFFLSRGLLDAEGGI